MTILGPSLKTPEWAKSPPHFSSRIEAGWGDPVSLVRSPADGHASHEHPGTLCLRLVPAVDELHVLGASGGALGAVSSRGPGLGYAFRRGDRAVWTVSTRSPVMRTHALVFADGDTWDVRTPFFWWMNVVATHRGQPHALGNVGASKRVWHLWVEPGRDDYDILSALTFLHRRWWRR